jgi:hypothetical protein
MESQHMIYYLACWSVPETWTIVLITCALAALLFRGEKP